ncbi:MAG TPA: hypothetical protein VE992_07785 [Solirubrobacteraceae bacterium]|nr:hypothetical protein [Solirubrobacteraceae bacterium]
MEVREVRAADPELSPETNAMLTSELRAVVGAESVRVPADRPHASQGELPGKHSVTEYLSLHRFQLVRTTAIMLTFGAIIALTTRDWWLLPLAAGVHALGTMTVVMTIVRMTTVIEHPAPEVAAALAEEGVSSPDERFSQMVEEFSQKPQRGAAEVLSPGFNDRSVPAAADPATAAAEQSSAMTPTEHPSRAAGERGAPDYLVWTTALSLLGLSIALPAPMGGGWMWLLTAVMVPLIACWMAMQRLMVTHPGTMRIESRKLLVAIVLCTTIAVAGFCAVVALAFHH